MRKPITLFIAVILILILFHLLYSFAEERITLTTYYPAPYGVYKEMRVDQMSVGSGYRNSGISDGILIVNGSVGIGTASPTDRLQVVGSGTAIKVTDGAVSNRFFSASSTLRGYVGTLTAHPFVLRTNDADRVTIDASGNVGVGTDGPHNKLDVAGAASVGYSGMYNAPLNGLIVGGNVGIGTASPGQKLDVIGNITSTGDISADGLIFAQDGLETQLNLVVDGNGAIGGNLGVGTYTPATRLHVDATTTAWDAGSGLAIFQDNSDRQIVIGGLGMFRRDYASNGADLRFNYLGYNGGNAYFRNFDIYDGKQSLILRVDGYNRKVDVALDANFSKDGFPLVKCNWNGRRNYQDDSGSGNDFGIVCRGNVIIGWCHYAGGGPASYEPGVYTCPDW